MDYYCDRCRRWFELWSSYEQHLLNSSFHDYCGSCRKDFPSYHALRQHLINSPRHYFCRECDTDFDDHASLIAHCLQNHFYCDRCDRSFKNATGLHEHNRQSHDYCVECRRVFNSASNLRSHMNSSIHRSKQVPCAFQHRGCTQSFVTKSAMILHLESGYCPSGVTRQMIDRWVQLHDGGNSITVPRRLIEDVKYVATGRSWNSDIEAWECVLCHRTFGTLDDLNRHLASPKHQQKTYRCPLSSCLATFTTLSGLCQHVESERCGILRFRAVREGMNDLLGDMGRLRIQGESKLFVTAHLALSMKSRLAAS